MTQYTIAYNEAEQRATIMLPGHQTPDGAKEIGMLDISSVGPNPTDASTQHITTMLQRKGYSSFDNLMVEVSREPVKDVIEQREDNPNSTEENGEGLENAVFPDRVVIVVGESQDLVAGSTKGMTLKSSDEEIVKVGRGGTVKALRAGSATVTVTNKAGNSNDVLIEARDATPASYAGVGDEAEAKEAEAA